MREPDSPGYGLVGISERVQAMGGRLSFSSKTGKGFALLAVLPHSHRPAPHEALVEAFDP